MQCDKCNKEVVKVTLYEGKWYCFQCHTPEYMKNVSFAAYDVKTGNLTRAHAMDIKSRRLAEDGKSLVRVKDSTNKIMPTFVREGYQKKYPYG